MRHLTTSDIDEDRLFSLDGVHYPKNLFHIDYGFRDGTGGVRETLPGIRNSETGGWLVYPSSYKNYTSNGVSSVSNVNAAVALIVAHLGVIGGAGGGVVVDPDDDTQLTALDGGTSLTSVFSTTIDGGNGSTIIFNSTYNGGEASTTF